MKLSPCPECSGSEGAGRVRAFGEGHAAYRARSGQVYLGLTHTDARWEAEEHGEPEVQNWVNSDDAFLFVELERRDGYWLGERFRTRAFMARTFDLYDAADAKADHIFAEAALAKAREG